MRSRLEPARPLLGRCERRRCARVGAALPLVLIVGAGALHLVLIVGAALHLVLIVGAGALPLLLMLL